MAPNSLFAKLLRSPWWVSLVVAVVLALVAAALLPAEYRGVAAVSTLPFVVISAIAARRQWRLPSAARVTATLEAVATMPWPAFAALLEAAFRREGYAVRRPTDGGGDIVDFELVRQGRTRLVSARRWKSARTGLDTLRALQAARAAADATEALCIGLGEVTDNARAFANAHRITLWQGDELARAFNGMPLPPRPPRCNASAR